MRFLSQRYHFHIIPRGFFIFYLYLVPQGTPGFPGFPGEKGSEGPQGKDGQPGLDGFPGPQVRFILIKLLGGNLLNSPSDVQYFRLRSVFCIFLQGPKGNKGDRGDRVSLLLV